MKVGDKLITVKENNHYPIGTIVEILSIDYNEEPIICKIRNVNFFTFFFFETLQEKFKLINQ